MRTLAKPATELMVQFRSLGTAHYVLMGKDYTVAEPYGDLKFVGRSLDFNVVGNAELSSRVYMNAIKPSIAKALSYKSSLYSCVYSKS